jgi:hypothetical protein
VRREWNFHDGSSLTREKIDEQTDSKEVQSDLAGVNWFDFKRTVIFSANPCLSRPLPDKDRIDGEFPERFSLNRCPACCLAF